MECQFDAFSIYAINPNRSKKAFSPHIIHINIWVALINSRLASNCMNSHHRSVSFRQWPSIGYCRARWQYCSASVGWCLASGWSSLTPNTYMFEWIFIWGHIECCYFMIHFGIIYYQRVLPLLSFGGCFSIGSQNHNHNKHFTCTKSEFTNPSSFSYKNWHFNGSNNF